MDYSHYLKIALEEAFLAEKRGNYPIGAILVDENGVVIARHGNESFTRADVSAHAEILCFKEAGELLSKKNNKIMTLYTTLEPCYGCGFFTTYTNIKKVVWSLTDNYKGELMIWNP